MKGNMFQQKCKKKIELFHATVQSCKELFFAKSSQLSKENAPPVYAGHCVFKLC